MRPPRDRDRPPAAAWAAYFLRLGAVGFGGPTALTARMRSDLVDERRWIAPDDFDLGLAISATCPGPLAYQLAVFCGYISRGFFGALAVGVSFLVVPFAVVTMAAAAYTSWGDNRIVRGLFFGAAPAVVVLIARATWVLGRTTLHGAWPAWAVCAIGCALTWATGQESLWFFAFAAAIGAWGLRPPAGSTPVVAATDSSVPPTTAMPALVIATAGSALGPSSTLFAFFFKTGCLIFGSGLAIVPFLRSAVVDDYQWLSAEQFLDSVTIGLVSPGPVVITATFVGYLVEGLSGAAAATAGMFLPAVLVTLVVTPWFSRHRGNRWLAGSVRGLTAAVIGVLAGTLPIVAGTAIPDRAALGVSVMTALLAATRRVSDPALVAIGAAAGLAIAFL